MASPISPSSSLGSGSGRPESESRNDWFLSDLAMKCTGMYQGGGSGSGSGTAGVRSHFDLGPPNRPSFLLPRQKIVEANDTFSCFFSDENEFRVASRTNFIRIGGHENRLALLAKKRRKITCDDPLVPSSCVTWELKRDRRAHFFRDLTSSIRMKRLDSSVVGTRGPHRAPTDQYQRKNEGAQEATNGRGSVHDSISRWCAFKSCTRRLHGLAARKRLRHHGCRDVTDSRSLCQGLDRPRPNPAGSFTCLFFFGHRFREFVGPLLHLGS
jgi:hypothetical protein